MNQYLMIPIVDNEFKRSGFLIVEAGDISYPDLTFYFGRYKRYVKGKYEVKSVFEYDIRDNYSDLLLYIGDHCFAGISLLNVTENDIKDFISLNIQKIIKEEIKS